MSFTQILEITAAVVVALGSGGAIVFGLSGWLGRVWAERLMERERSKHASALEELRSELRHDSEAELNRLRSELEIYREKHLKGHSDKVLIYRLSADIICDFLADMDFIQIHGKAPADGAARMDQFNRSRMKAYGYLGMLAPQTVMDAFDALVDHLIMISGGREPYDWPRVRSLVLALLNEIRKDIGIDVSSIEYRGQL